jgi:DNA-binding response OmpR family regulator
MVAETIYMVNGRGPDHAIMKGLAEAGCEVRSTHGVVETMNMLRAMASSPRMHSGQADLMLIAEVQAGAIPLLTLLRENGMSLPPTLLFDQEGTNIQAVIKALQLGVQDYVLASEPEPQRELRARILAERLCTRTRPNHKIKHSAAAVKAPQASVANGDFQWDPEACVIYVDDKYVRLSPVEGRVFDLLLARRNRTVSMEELIAHGLSKRRDDLDSGIRLLRPHMMRLRNKLERHPELAHRIVNVRGSGYMFV